MLKWFRKPAFFGNQATPSPEQRPKQSIPANPPPEGRSAADAFKVQGNEFLLRGQLRDAERCYRQALSADPNYAEAHNNLGVVLREQGQLEAAEGHLRQAIALDEGLANAYYNLGILLESAGNLAEARILYGQAVAKGAANSDAHLRLGRLHYLAGQYEEAIGDLRLAISVDPMSVGAHCNLALVLVHKRQFAEAEICARRAVALAPDHAEAHNNLGVALHDQGKLDEAAASYRRAIAIRPAYFEAYTNLGLVLQNLGQLDEAIASYRQALQIKPNYVSAESNMLFCLHCHPGVSPAAVFAAHRQWNQRHAAHLADNRPPHANSRDAQRRLRIGYVSPDFRHHPVTHFVAPLIERHDRANFEVFCYYNHTENDNFTAGIAAAADHWTPCFGMPDDDLAQRIRDDQIDILVDLAGHTDGNRLLVFARKPAPVQVTYLGYPASTGLTAINYRLTHVDADPPGNEAYNSERLYRLPNSLYCYRSPATEPPQSSPTPALANGFLTFGSMNNFAKVSSETIALWAGILHALPDARLVMTSVAGGTAQQSAYDRFASLGIDAHRLILHGRLPYPEFRRLHHQIDIALDAFPYNGTTTTCETLWLGVPVVALTGQVFVSRMGYMLLRALGLNELAAPDKPAYVATAVALARDSQRLNSLRSGLHARFIASPLRDEAGLTRDIEAAYRDMWRQWCAA